jgi:hypothetical protein
VFASVEQAAAAQLASLQLGVAVPNIPPSVLASNPGLAAQAAAGASSASTNSAAGAVQGARSASVAATTAATAASAAASSAAPIQVLTAAAS